MKRTPLAKVSKKPKKVKKLSTSKLKKKLDEIFSKYIRQKYADSEGYVRCITCGVKRITKEMQAGHFVSRSYLATRFDEQNVFPQCAGCNVFGGGRTVEFAKELSSRFGATITIDLYEKAQGITKNFPYAEKIAEYEKKLNDLN